MEAIDKQKLASLIAGLEVDLPVLESQECFKYHDPAYYSYVAYYDELIGKLLELGSANVKNVYGAYLVGLAAYQALDLKKSMFEVCKVILDELQEKLKLIVAEEEQDGDDSVDIGTEVEPDHKCQA